MISNWLNSDSTPGAIAAGAVLLAVMAIVAILAAAEFAAIAIVRSMA